VIALVGKGITFDTGGISIKPGQAMDEMKYDKCGACAVLGAVQAISDLGLPVRLRAYLALAENMPDGTAYRPGDILRYRNGKSVEVLNTDAEGRLVLADALLWAADERPDSIVELSTLTGATVVALGHHGAALYTPDETLAEELLAASASSGDRLWRMPLWPEFREALRGTHGDLKNVAGRWGGANAAAAFLADFMGETGSWAHLDIAGTAWIGPDQKGPQGATGFGVGLIVAWLLERAGAA
jgi:leucyl aminopeptidase